ncbi:hypothetical protein OF83DRAFT_1084227 [Amylostereum chailletii]|nr:hypothetical protein OF83DRAFT_1084227 [Amylostereum chailletii]
MVKLSLWDKERSPPAGTSFTPSFNERPKTAPPPSGFPSFRRLSTDPVLSSSSSSSSSALPILSLTLSSPSFLDSVVHDGVSDNPLYVIETEANLTKIRRSDAKGFINVARVRWREDPAFFSKSKKELSGVLLAFGKGQWKPADEFLGYSYSSLSSYRKFYLPHHSNSLRWKRSGSSSYSCTTATVKGPVAILEPAVLIAPPHIKIFDPIFRTGSTARPQRSHAGVPISLLDFLLVTSMLLLTEHDEWTNVTRTRPVTTAPADDGAYEEDSVRHLPPSSSVTSTPSRSATIDTLHNPSSASLVSGFSSGMAPSFGLDNWRNNVSERPRSPDDRWPSSSREPGSPVRASGASQSSADSDAISTPASPTHHTFSYRSGSSISSHNRQPYHSAPSLSNTHARDLPIPPLPTSHYVNPKHSRTFRGPDSSAQSRYARSPSPTSRHSTYPSQSSRDGEPWRISTELSRPSAMSSSASVYNLSGPSSAHPSHAESQWPPTTPGSSTPSLHHYPHTPITSRSLPPIPPVPTIDRSLVHKSPLSSPNVIAVPSLPHPPSLTRSGTTTTTRMSTVPHRSQSYNNLRRTTIKAPPNYLASTQDNTVHPSDLGLLDAMQAFGINDGGAHAPGGQVLSQGMTEVMRPDSVYDAPPPAYSQLDMARSPLQ